MPGYHYSPGRDQAADWFGQQGLAIVEEGFGRGNGWGHRHFLLRPGPAGIMTRSVLRYRGQLAARNTHRDELHLLGFPIVPGRGKRLLAASGGKVPLKLAASAAVETGVLNLTYARTRPLAVPGPAR